MEIYIYQASCPLSLPLLNIPNCQSVLQFLSLYCKLFIFAWQLHLQIRVHELPLCLPGSCVVVIMLKIFSNTAGISACYPLQTIERLVTIMPGRIAQSVTCLATDACLTADPGVASSIPVRSHTFVEIDHEMISTVILPLPLIHSRRVVVSYKRKYEHKLLVNRLFKPAQEKVWLGELTVPQ